MSDLVLVAITFYVAGVLSGRYLVPPLVDYLHWLIRGPSA